MKTLVQAKNYLVTIGLFLIMVTVASLHVTLGELHTKHEELAAAMGRSFFQTFVAARRWNADHNGVYVPVTKGFMPNLYLDDPLRDLTATNGMKLTKVNPAYMTRLISEVLQQKQGIQVHITSLKLLRPANKADEWETKALENFEKDKKEEYAVIGSREKSTFRYMAPLKVEKPCLKCHGKQGYKEGDIRGGITVNFSYEPFYKIIRAHQLNTFIIHLIFLAIGLFITFFLGKKLISSIEELQNAQQQIRKLEGILPICSSCKKIRTKKAAEHGEKSWVAIEEYISDRTDAEFSHGICPDCMKKLYPNIK
ncbi:MAG: DUF3365 domain-containing protein [Nitrospiraceae bacterium]|nr:DUF3365 domain-containing protein [Nitrospiraceae bacterium]